MYRLSDKIISWLPRDAIEPDAIKQLENISSLHGVVDSGIEFLDESGRFLQSIIAAILSPLETKDALVAAIDEFVCLNL